MKEITEEKVREVKETITLYESPDGTRFTTIEECKKYEESALGMMRAKVKHLMSEKKDAWDTMGGMDDHLVVAVHMEDEADVDTVIQWLFLECPWYLQDYNEKKKEEVLKIIDTAFIEKDALIFGINCEEEYYFINSRENIISNLNKLTKEDNA